MTSLQRLLGLSYSFRWFPYDHNGYNFAIESDLIRDIDKAKIQKLQ